MVNNSISDHEQKQCVGECPKNNMFLAANGKECLQKCDFYAIENGLYQCKTECSQKYEDGAITGTKLCRNKCSESTKQYVALDGKQCVSACEDAQYIDVVDNEKYCKENCGTMAINKASRPYKCDSSCYYYMQGGQKTCTSQD